MTPDAAPDTSTTSAARAHARAQADRRVRHQPVVPPSLADDVVDGAGQPVGPERMLWDEVLGPGAEATRVLPRGTVIRLTDLEGDACVNLLAYNAMQPLERLNVADTVKVQWQAYLGPGTLLLSDMGRVLLSVVADTSGHHDALCGASNEAGNARRYGRGGAHGDHPNARDRFAVALAKHGLERRDIVPNVNLFKRVTVERDGGLRFDGGSGTPALVELRAELPVILVVANTPHVLDPRPEYTVSDVRVTAWRERPTTRDDAAWWASPEAERAFLQTEEFLLAGSAW